MKLEGSLDAFGLPDIFQLLSFTKKTGGLHLACGDSDGDAGSDGADAEAEATSTDGVVYFVAGQVTGASADGSRQPLARRLVGSGAVADEALAAAVEAATDGEVGVVRALVQAEAVDTALVRAAASEQAVDAVFDLLRWRSGDFAFVVDEANPDDVGVSVPIESVLAEAEERRAAWTSVSQVITSPQVVPFLPVVLEADPAVSRDEWTVLALVDGRRAVAELVGLTGSGQFAVVSTLAALVQRGLVVVADQATNSHVAVISRRQQLLAPLEGQPFVPVRSVDTDTDETDHADSSLDGEDSKDSKNSKAKEPAEAATSGAPALLGGAHVPRDVVPPRPEPFLPRRQADFDESRAAPAIRAAQVQAGPSATVGDVIGATVTAPDHVAASVIERDPSVNRSLMLRLIAGVRGL